MLILIILLNYCLAISEEDDYKYFVKEFDIIYSNIPNQKGFNSLLSLKHRTYSMYYYKKGIYFYLEEDISYTHDGDEYYFSLGGMFGLKAVLIPESNMNYPFKLDIDIGLGFASLSSETYYFDFNWLPEYMGVKVSSNIIIKYNRVGLVLGYSHYFELPFSRAFNIGLNYRIISPREMFD